jgi:hypothetical protein
MLDSPLMQSLKRLDLRKDSFTGGLYLVIVVLWFFLFLLPFSPGVQRIMMGKFHLTLRPFHRWAAAQVVPSMYNFQNNLSWSLRPVSENFDLLAIPHLPVNHFPLRLLFFNNNRQSIIFNHPVYIYISSIYRQRTMVSSYLLLTTPEHITIQFLNAYEFVDR